MKSPASVVEQTELDKKLVFSLAKTKFPNYQQLKYLNQYLSNIERLIIRILILVVIGSTIFLGTRFYLRHIQYLPKEGGKYTEALVGQPKYINPILCQTNDVDMDISSLVFSGLFKYDQKQNLVPDIAESYQISDDQKEYTIKIKPNINFHNGNPLLVDDIIFTVNTILDSDYKSPLLSSLKGVQIERVDDVTIKFTLQEPFAPFLSNLTFGILPAHIWSDMSYENALLTEYNTKPIGSGPYQFNSLTKEKSGNIKSYTLIRNENYYGKKPNINKITFYFYPDFESAIEILKNRDVEGISLVPKDLKDILVKNKNLNHYLIQLPQYSAVFLNQKNKLLKDKDIKQALAYAIDKSQIIKEALKGEGVIIDAPILEGYLGYNPDVKKYEYNPEKAKEILDKAGWKVPAEGGIRKKDNAELKFSLTTVDQPEYMTAANILKEKWEAIGVGVELKIMSSARVDKEVIKPKDYEAFLYGEILGADPDPFPFWHSSQIPSGGLNLSNYYNKDVDKLLEEARKTNNLDERAKKYIDFQNILAEDLPAIFLYNPNYHYAVDKKIKGINIEHISIPSDRFNEIGEWYIKTKKEWK